MLIFLKSIVLILEPQDIRLSVNGILKLELPIGMDISMFDEPQKNIVFVFFALTPLIHLLCLFLDYGNRCSGLGFLLLDKFLKPNLHPSLVIQLDFHSIISNVSLCSKKRPRLFHPFNYSPSNQWRQLILPCNSLLIPFIDQYPNLSFYFFKHPHYWHFFEVIDLVAKGFCQYKSTQCEYRTNVWPNLQRNLHQPIICYMTNNIQL